MVTPMVRKVVIRWQLVLIAACLATGFSGSAPAASPTSSEAEELKAIAGTHFGFFLGSNLTSLQFAANDAVRMCFRHVVELGTIAPENAVLVLDGTVPEESLPKLRHLSGLGVTVITNATVNLAAKAFGQFIGNARQRANAQSFCLVFASGHGVESQGEPFVLLPPDALPGAAPIVSISAPPVITGLSVKVMARELESLPERAARLIVLDACRKITKGAPHTPPRAGKEFFSALADAAGTITVTSCRSGEESEEWLSLRAGLFTHYWLAESRKSPSGNPAEIVELGAFLGSLSETVATASGGKMRPDWAAAVDSHHDLRALRIPVGVPDSAILAKRRRASRTANCLVLLTNAINRGLLSNSPAMRMQRVLAGSEFTISAKNELLWRIEDGLGNATSRHDGALTNWWTTFTEERFRTDPKGQVAANNPKKGNAHGSAIVRRGGQIGLMCANAEGDQEKLATFSARLMTRIRQRLVERRVADSIDADILPESAAKPLRQVVMPPKNLTFGESPIRQLQAAYDSGDLDRPLTASYHVDPLLPLMVETEHLSDYLVWVKLDRLRLTAGRNGNRSVGCYLEWSLIPLGKDTAVAWKSSHRIDTRAPSPPKQSQAAGRTRGTAFDAGASPSLTDAETDQVIENLSAEVAGSVNAAVLSGN